ncbi:MAG: helix-hairpin-helix domain-containing protein [Promethearchaeota archaeon]
MIEYEGAPVEGKKTQLPILKGIGSKTAKKLVRAGYNSIETLAKAKPERLQEIPGIGPKISIRLVYEANYYLGANEKKVVEPIKEERVVEPIKEERVVEPIKEERVVEPIKEERVVEPIKEERVVEPIKEERVVEPIKEFRKEEETAATFREALLMARRREMAQFRSQVRNLQAKLVLGEISKSGYYSQKRGYDQEIRDLEEEIIAPVTVNPSVTKRMRSSMIKQKITSLEKQLLQKTISPARFFELRDKYERELKGL